MGLFAKIFGTYSDHQIKKLKVTADQIVALSEKYEAMRDEELRAQTALLRQRLASGETLDDILPDVLDAFWQNERFDRTAFKSLVPNVAHAAGDMYL